MTQELRLSQIGQISVPVKDVERATAFYRDQLGMAHLFTAPPGLSFFDCGGVRLMLSRPEGPGQETRSSVDLWMAFFDDSEANMLAIMSEVPKW